MNGLTYFLKDVAIYLALLLFLRWTGANLEWYHGLAIVLAGIAMAWQWSERAMSFTVQYMLACKCDECAKSRASM